jgi:Cohesin domain/Dockerin type I domain
MAKLFIIPAVRAWRRQGAFLSCVAAWLLISFGARGAHNVTLGWTASVDPTAVGYAVYYGTNSGVYASRVDAGANTTTTISNLEGGLTYYFVAVSYDTNKVESAFSNEISYQPPLSVGGTVAYYPLTYPMSGLSATRVGDATMLMGGGTNQSGLTLSDGGYGWDDLAPGDSCCVAAIKSDDSPTADGVTVADLALIQRHILGISRLDSPYKLLAADVNGSKDVTVADLALIQRLILGMTNSFPAGLWRFVPADYAFADTNNPWDAPTNVSYASLTADSANLNFVAIKLGDVNDSWTPPVTGQGFAGKRIQTAPAGPPVVFSIGRQVAPPGSRVTVPVRVERFSQVSSAQFTLSWDPAVLRYVGTGDYGLRGISDGSFGTAQTGQGRLSFAWYDPQATGVTAPNGAAIFSVSFDIAGPGSTGAALAFADTPTAPEVGVNFAAAAFTPRNGGVIVSYPVPLRVSAPSYRDGAFGMSVPTEQGRHYVLEATDSLSNPNWRAVRTIAGNGTFQSLTDPSAPASQRFYRVLAQ